MDKFLRILNFLTDMKLGYVLTLFICEMLYTAKSKPRKIPKIPYPVFFFVVYAAYYTFGFFLPSLPVPSLQSMLIFTVSVLAQWAVFDLHINRVLFNCVAGYATQNLGINVCNLFFNFVKVGGWGRFFIRISLLTVVYVACYFLFARRSRRAEMNIRSFKLYVTSFFTVLVTSTIFSIARKNHSFGMELNMALVICCILALMLQFSEFYAGNRAKEAVELESLLYYEQKQHALTQETIDLINIKCHDLKKQVNALKQLLGDAADDVLGETEKVLLQYDDLVQTGNKNLDIVITEEKNYCRNRGISIDVMADGSQLDFMSPADIYSLFSNALNNAIESVIQEDEENRNVKLDIHLNGEYVCISVVNVCTRPVDFSAGRPVTNKSDKNFHGYGMRSMEYIVDKYGGNMVTELKDCVFTVKIIIKKPK